VVFKHDIFISYAHLDNLPLREGERKWVDDFHSALAVRVAQSFGKKPEIWRDPKLAGNDDFSEGIHQQLPESALLVMVLSNPYIESKWCNDEVVAFCQACNLSGGLAIGEKTRVFKVIKSKPDETKAKEELRAMIRKVLGYPFYVTDPDSGHIHEVSLDRNKDLFLDRLDDLAFDIVNLLNKMRNPVAAAAEPDKPVIYVAQTSHDLDTQKAALRRDLERRGYTVLPNQPLPLEAEELTRFVGQQLAQAALSVHMVGARYGVIPEGSTQSIIETQIELARERAKQPGFVRLVWLPKPAPESNDEKNIALIARLREDGGWSADADLLETSLDSLKTSIDERLEALRRPSEVASAVPTANGPARVYLLCDAVDESATQPLNDFLFDQGFDVMLPMFAASEPDAAKRLAEHRAILKSCDAVVVFYGIAGESFLRQSIRDLQDCAPLRTQPLRAKAICIATPAGAATPTYRTHEAVMIDQTKGLTRDNWGPFLNALKAAQ
jgi:hypothetical protein